MAIPRFIDLFEDFLIVINDNTEHTLKSICIDIAHKRHLTLMDLTTMTRNQRQSTLYNRVSWAGTYLLKAGLIETPQRGNYKITNDGKEALETREKINIKFLMRYETFRQFRKATKKRDNAKHSESIIETPTETMNNAYQQIHATLACQLMDEIMKLTPVEFERLILKLLIKIYYGDDIDNVGRITKPTRDGGIDGMIREDILGFNKIYFQAKKWDVNTTIPTTEIQKFVGAIKGKHAQKGLFITTAKYNKNAEEYIQALDPEKVVLVDGDKLSELMIEYNVGVESEQMFEIKKVNSDFFNEI